MEYFLQDESKVCFSNWKKVLGTAENFWGFHFLVPRAKLSGVSTFLFLQQQEFMLQSGESQRTEKRMSADFRFRCWKFVSRVSIQVFESCSMIRN